MQVEQGLPWVLFLLLLLGLFFIVVFLLLSGFVFFPKCLSGNIAKMLALNCSFDEKQTTIILDILCLCSEMWSFLLRLWGLFWINAWCLAQSTKVSSVKLIAKYTISVHGLSLSSSLCTCVYLNIYVCVFLISFCISHCTSDCLWRLIMPSDSCTKCTAVHSWYVYACCPVLLVIFSHLLLSLPLLLSSKVDDALGHLHKWLELQTAIFR